MGPGHRLRDVLSVSDVPVAARSSILGGMQLRTVVVSLSRPPHDARTHYRQVASLLQHGHEVTYLAPYAAFGLIGADGHLDPTFSDVRAVDVPLARRGRVLASVRAAAGELEHRAAATDVVLASDAVLVPSLLRLRRRHPRLTVVWDVREDPAPQVPAGARAPAALAAVVRAVHLHAERRLHLTLADEAFADRFERVHPVFPDTVRVPPDPPEQHSLDHRVVALGAMTTERGVEDLLALAERVAPHVRVDLVGAAPPVLDAQLRARTAGTTVDYHGFLPPRLALEKLVGALASVSLPRAPGAVPPPRTDVVASLAYGVPVVTTPDPPSCAEVERVGGGFVVPFGDVDAAAERVVALLTDRDARAEMGRRAWEASRRSLDWTVDGLRFVHQVEAWAERSRRRAQDAARPSGS